MRGQTKLLVVSAVVLAFAFNGCASRAALDKLRYENHKKALLIEKQRKIIDSLKKKLRQQKLQAQQKQTQKTPPSGTQAKPKIKKPVKPKKNIKLKKVEDTNYSPQYMYPDTQKKKQTPAKPKALAQKKAMSKAECIAMIGQEKFDRYTKMFGSETAAIKRCVLMRSLRR